MKKNIIKIVSEVEKGSLILLRSPQTTSGLKRSLRNLLKEVVMFRAHAKTPRTHDKIVKNCFVQVGGGGHYLQGYINIDIAPPADIIWDVREGIPLRSGSVQFLFSEHFLEHIDYPISAKKFIKECYRVLGKDGKVVIGVPDSQAAVKAYFRRDKKMIDHYMHRWYSKRDCLEHFNTSIDFLNYHFRDQDDHKKYNPHYWAYDYEKLCSLLKNAGFSNIKKWRFDGIIANPKRKWGSIYITAKK
jgi:predicted SAM-dependent methyltransferase